MYTYVEVKLPDALWRQLKSQAGNSTLTIPELAVKLVAEALEARERGNDN